MKLHHLENNYMINSKLYNPNTKYNTEAYLFLYNLKKKKMLFKNYFNDFKDTIDNKIYTLEYLDEYKDKINLEELVIPEYFVFLDGEFKGIMMEYIDGINMENIIYNSSYTIKEKMNLLKKVGLFLQKLDKINEKERINFFIGDLHEGNIIVDKNNNIRFVDLDSCKIGSNAPSYSKYLTKLINVWIDNKKYKVDKRKHIIIPNRDTDLYCYNMMVLNTLFQGNVSNLDISIYYDYLNYLESINIDKELLDKLAKIYTKESNENIYEYLDTIGENGYKAHRNIFKIKTK